jgi:hypothetical protein
MKHKICALSKICIYPNLIIKKIDILGQLQINLKIQNISFENSSLGKHVFWEKGPQKRTIVLNAK